jgi:Replication-relaxation
METLKRRSRMRRISTGKRIELTERDIELFKLLNRYRYLRSNFLYSFLGGNSKTRFKERLGHLYHDGRYINRPAQQWQFANCRHMPLIYELDAKGEQLLRQQGLVQSDSPLLQKGRAGACRQFAHDLMICDCVASIELGMRENPGLRFISWQEIIAKAPETTRALHNPFEIPVSISHTFSNSKGTQRADIKIVPDALFGLEYTSNGQKSYRFFALEADRNQMPVARSNLRQSSYLKKILAYRAIAAQNIYKTHLGIPNFLVLNVITNERHMRSIMGFLDEMTAKHGSQMFLFKSISTLGDFRVAPAPASHILVAPWKRVGSDDFCINKT